MRTLSKKTQYCLRALYSLTRAGGRPVLISDLATNEHIPKKFLEQILLNLKGRGLVDSKSGRGGGYMLVCDPEVVTLGQVIRMVEGPLAPLPCASETAYRKCDECTDDQYCETRLVMRDVRDGIARVLDGTTLAAACRRADRARQDAVQANALMYYI
ncbi:MAG: Rrf2 family transcriptional regulator [Candidatus Solibacter sp.]